jgi:hypothetical protein
MNAQAPKPTETPGRRTDRQPHVGKLDKALDEAANRKWTVVDMKAEWNVVFPGSAEQK